MLGCRPPRGIFRTIYSCLERLLPDIWFRVPGVSRKTIFLTFDDGPDPQFTPKILEILDEHQVTATFFLIGKKIVQHPEIVYQTAKAGHTLGNHSLRHKKWNFDRRELKEEITRTNQLITEIIGKAPRYFRPPHGRITYGMRKLCESYNMKLILWDVCIPDYRMGFPKEAIVQRILRYSGPGSIILMHDGSRNSRQTINALSEVLPILRDQGVTLKGLPQSLEEYQRIGYSG